MQQVGSGASTLHQRYSSLMCPRMASPNELQRNSQRCNKCTCHVKADSNNLLLNLNAAEEIEYAHNHQSKDEATAKS